MSIPLLPAPGVDRTDQGQEAHDNRHTSEDCGRAQRSRDSNRKDRVATVEECLAALTQLPVLVVTGMLSTAQANTIRSMYTAILQHHQRRRTDDRGGVADDAMLEMLSRHPEMANLLEPLLSDEQIASIMARAKGGSHGS